MESLSKTATGVAKTMNFVSVEHAIDFLKQQLAQFISSNSAKVPDLPRLDLSKATNQTADSLGKSVFVCFYSSFCDTTIS